MLTLVDRIVNELKVLNVKWSVGQTHFLQDNSSPFARFEPTAKGWIYARKLADTLP